MENTLTFILNFAPLLLKIEGKHLFWEGFATCWEPFVIFIGLAAATGLLGSVLIDKTADEGPLFLTTEVSVATLGLGLKSDGSNLSVDLRVKNVKQDNTKSKTD